MGSNRLSQTRQEPLVYVVILSWNRAEDASECLTSLQHLDYQNCRVVVVDNGSTDETVTILRARFPDVTIVENQRNLGYAAGNNVGIQFALEHGADYILLLNDDIIVEPDVLSQLVRAGEADSKVGILCPTIISYFDHSVQYAGGSINWQRLLGLEVLTTAEELEARDTEYAPGSALLIKTSLVRQIGLLDPDYFAYFEDVDWSLRARRAGYRVAVVPRAKIYHKGTFDQVKTKSSDALYYFGRNKWLFMRQHTAWVRRLGLSYRITRDALLQFQAYELSGDCARADAILNGWWAGYHGRYGHSQLQAPPWFGELVRRRLNVLLWLTAPLENLRRRIPVRTTAGRIWRKLQHTRRAIL